MGKNTAALPASWPSTAKGVPLGTGPTSPMFPGFSTLCASTSLMFIKLLFEVLLYLWDIQNYKIPWHDTLLVSGHASRINKAHRQFKYFISINFSMWTSENSHSIAVPSHGRKRWGCCPCCGDATYEAIALQVQWFQRWPECLTGPGWG